MFSVTGRVFALATFSALALGAPAQAVEEQHFKFTMVHPTTHWWMTEGIQPFIDAVAAASDGKITFDVYPAAQLGKESVSIVAAGLAEFGLIIPSFEVEKLALTSVVELPGFHKTACDGTAKFWELAKEDGLLWREEFAKLGVRPLFGFLLNPYEVQTTKKVIDSVDDMAGLKLRANGAMAKAVAALGGVPVQVTAGEFYDALARGTVDGGMWLSSSSRQYGLEDLLAHGVTGTSMGGGVTFVVVSEKVWQGLDDETRQIVLDAAAPISQHMCEFMDSSEAADKAAFTAAGKLTLHELPPDEAAKWNEKILSVADQWAKEMDSTGRPGTQILEEYRAIAERK